MVSTPFDQVLSEGLSAEHDRFCCDALNDRFRPIFARADRLHWAVFGQLRQEVIG